MKSLGPITYVLVGSSIEGKSKRRVYKCPYGNGRRVTRSLNMVRVAFKPCCARPSNFHIAKLSKQLRY